MEKTKKKRSFDAVNMMREIRDRISAETQNMTAEQIKNYVKAKLAENNIKPIGQ